MIPAPSLNALLAVATARVDGKGRLLEANSGFLRLLPQPGIVPGADVTGYFIQPTFAALLRAPADKDGLIHNGLLTLGEFSGRTCSLRASVWRENDVLRLLAEHDIEDLERLNATVLALNNDYTLAQLELTRINLKQKQTMNELQATNTRLIETQKKLVEAEKMAALGVMVAGVAHELSTPLGVCLVAASTLEKNRSALAQHFAERSMSQKELEHYIETAGAGTTMISNNLEYIGELINTFRAVAVTGRPVERKHFSLRSLLDEVLCTYGTALSGERIVISIDCDPALEVDAVRADWATIFTNLIANSLRHAFKGREQGRIDIRVSGDAEKLSLTYSDDGVGLTPTAREHIFDPFFTTEIQLGMGLGMHLVYNLITQRMRGSIQCDSAPERGGRFDIEVPR